MRSLLTLATTFTAALAALADPPKPQFDPPVRLTADGRPINQTEKLLYPSPVLLDIDGDTRVELVVGDLWGKLRVYPAAGKRGELAWGKGANLQVKGKDLTVPNW